MDSEDKVSLSYKDKLLVERASAPYRRSLWLREDALPDLTLGAAPNVVLGRRRPANMLFPDEPPHENNEYNEWPVSLLASTARILGSAVMSVCGWLSPHGSEGNGPPIDDPAMAPLIEDPAMAPLIEDSKEITAQEAVALPLWAQRRLKRLKLWPQPTEDSEDPEDSGGRSQYARDDYGTLPGPRENNKPGTSSGTEGAGFPHWYVPKDDRSSRRIWWSPSLEKKEPGYSGSDDDLYDNDGDQSRVFARKLDALVPKECTTLQENVEAMERILRLHRSDVYRECSINAIVLTAARLGIWDDMPIIIISTVCDKRLLHQLIILAPLLRRFTQYNEHAQRQLLCGVQEVINKHRTLLSVGTQLLRGILITGLVSWNELRKWFNCPSEMPKDIRAALRYCCREVLIEEEEKCLKRRKGKRE